MSSLDDTKFLLFWNKYNRTLMVNLYRICGIYTRQWIL